MKWETLDAAEDDLWGSVVGTSEQSLDLLPVIPYNSSFDRMLIGTPNLNNENLNNMNRPTEPDVLLSDWDDAISPTDSSNIDIENITDRLPLN